MKNWKQKTGKNRAAALKYINYIKKTKPQWKLDCYEGCHVKLFNSKGKELDEGFKLPYNGNSIITAAYNCLRKTVEEQKRRRAEIEAEHQSIHEREMDKASKKSPRTYDDIDYLYFSGDDNLAEHPDYYGTPFEEDW